MLHKDLQTDPRKNGKYDEISKAINWLIWLRLWVILFIGFFFACMGLYILAIMATGRRTHIIAQQEKLSRIPGVKQFILSKSRSWEPTKDKEVDNCAICLEEYS